ncbi:MAG: family 10 glycosylhydrolase [Mediterranea sp.]|jgi:uncharacterized lipoprotein YddW (UPF0748 family)|nr:family 10 glycosylhydrolase [Mediterranea sp.]
MKHLKLLTICLLGALMTSCADTPKAPESYPLFWTWLDYHPSMNFDSVCRVMQETGIDGVMLNAATPDQYRQAIPVAHKYGIEVYAWLWTMNLEHGRDSIVKAHPDWQSVNRNGDSLADSMAYVNYYKFMCPILPEVRDFIRQKIEAYCAVEGLNGIAIDYHRFVDVILPTTLWPHYGIVQDKEYPQWDYGYHPRMIEAFKAQYGYDPREQDDPSTDAKWLQFRCDQITEVANMIADIVHSHGKKMAASPFPTPKMAKSMVRQDWGKWNLDIVFPMVYHNFYTGDPSFIADCTIENVRDKNPKTTLYCGIMAPNDPTLFTCMNEALNNGAKGIAIFTVNSLLSPEIRQQFKAYSDSVRAVRNMPQVVSTDSVAPKHANLDPFVNVSLMKLIEGRMTDLISKDASTAPLLQLSNYRLVNQYGTTKVYEVIDAASGTMFDVTFYLYGDVIAGWDVKKIVKLSNEPSKNRLISD